MKRIASVLVLMVLSLGVWCSSPAQIPGIDLKLLKKIPGLADILKSPPALTTSFADAVTEVPYLDDFNPTGAFPLSKLRRTPDGGFVLERPGVFLFESQSYCLGPGKHAPGGQHGYLYAPLRGPRADIIRTVLRKSWAQPDIPQRDVQVLLWAIISRMKFSDMGRNRQATAARLLTPQQIIELDGGALGLIPDGIKNEALKNLPPSVRRIVAAEAQLRRLLTKAESTYEEMERVAVPSGSAPPNPKDRAVPRGRWSLHPDGYFIRFSPRSYKRLLIEICRPAPMRVRRDDHGRILGIADSMGNRLEAEYDDTQESLKVAGDPSLEGFAFRSVRFEGPGLERPAETFQAEWSCTGWTFLGVPSGNGKIPAGSTPFLRAPERYEWAQKHKRELDVLSEGLKKLGDRSASRGFSSAAAEDIMALGHFTAALRDIIPRGFMSGKSLTTDPLALGRKAWLSAVVGSLGDLPSPPVFDPAEDPQPSNSGEQSNGGSGRGTDKAEDCQRQYDASMDEATKKLDERVKDCLSKEGFDKNLCDSMAIALCLIEIYLGHRDSSALQDCIMDACHGGAPAYGCIHQAAAAYFAKLMKAQEDYKKCMGK